MTMHRFLTNPAGKPPVMPSARWLEAFPDGSWGDWNALHAGGSEHDIVWVSVNYPNWAERVTELIKAVPARAVVVVSPIPHDAEGLRAIDIGARGYCHQHAQPALMQEVARAVQAGALWVGPELVDRLVAAARTLLTRAAAEEPVDREAEVAPGPDLSMLSPRELEVAQQVALGKTNKEIARELDITERTVKAHLGSTFEKLGVRDRLQLVLFMSPQPTHHH